MYRLMQYGKKVGEVYSADMIQSTIASLLRAGIISTIKGVALHDDDVDLANSELLSLSIDKSLNEIGLTSREQRIIIANGSLLSLNCLARLILKINDPDNESNNEQIANWSTMADDFIRLQADDDSILNVLGIEEILEKILSYSRVTGAVIKSDTLKREAEIKKGLDQ